jgi:hypothetical protein
MIMTLCAALAFPIEERVVKEYQANQKKGLTKHPHKINRTYAYWSTLILQDDRVLQLIGTISSFRNNDHAINSGSGLPVCNLNGLPILIVARVILSAHIIGKIDVGSVNGE